MPQRIDALESWLAEVLGHPDIRLTTASADASFRRYFRVHAGGQTWIAMDAPPDREDCGQFIKVARLLFSMGLNVPEILQEERQAGFLLLSDLGERLYLDVLEEGTVERLYGDAMAALAVIQACGPCNGQIPEYDRRLLMDEMGLFRDWLLGRHLGIKPDRQTAAMLEGTFERLADNALEQPRVFVHRDYHSRNLMVTGANNPGILDFQDAVTGPVTYDLVSLLRDCYIEWPRARIEDWVLGYHELALESGILRSEQEDESRFLRWFDLMGVQRHLKASGIFARLNHRDGKPGYLKDIPRTLGYILDVAERYPELAELRELVSSRVVPGLDAGSRQGGA